MILILFILYSSTKNQNTKKYKTNQTTNKKTSKTRQNTPGTSKKQKVYIYNHALIIYQSLQLICIF